MMRRRWGPVLELDPYYNVNLSLNQPFLLAFPPKDKLPTPKYPGAEFKLEL